MIRPLLLSLVLSLGAGGGAALAQAVAPDQNELVALNFYVQQNDDAAVEAELRRLQVKYPNWVPPQDLSRLSRTGPSHEIDEIYRNIAASRFNDARAGIAAAQAEFPDWRPPAELSRLLTTAEAQQDFERLLKAGQIAELQALTQRVPDLMRCDRINNAWRFAEMLRQAGQVPAALASYRAVANSCVNPAEVGATLEKASALTDRATLEAMFQEVEARLPAHQARWSALRNQLLGQGKAGTQMVVQPSANAPEAKPLAEPAVTPPSRTLAPAPARPQNMASPPAESVQPAPKRQAPARNGRMEALVAAGDWRGCMAASTGKQPSSVTYQRGWCAYNLEQPMEAIASFRAALAGGLDAVQTRDANYGLALSYLKLNMANDAAKIAARVNLDMAQRLEVEGQILNQRGILSYNAKEYRKAIDYFDAYEKIKGGIPRDLAILRAYAYLNSGHLIEARRQFEILNNQMATNETRRGLAATKPW